MEVRGDGGGDGQGVGVPFPGRLAIPTELETSAAYKARIGSLLARDDAHVYVDTSFLMWATKIGPASRGELLDWLRSDLGDRVHVPTWSAHEYLRHHIAGTIVEELKVKSDEVAQVVGSTFSYFRPFLDDPALPAAEGYDRMRTSTREAINTLQRLVDTAKQWRRAYPAHAEEMIRFINERVMDAGDLYERLPATAIEGAARYEGRIPPGFQDRNKKGVRLDDDIDSAPGLGANRYGDLIFWQESLRHAAAAKARAVVILTNDRKNDWRMGGESAAEIDDSMLALRKTWRAVPRVHPMLSLEAQMSGIDQVALMDSQYLAAYLRGIEGVRVGSFVDVAIVPDPPPAGDARAEAVARRAVEDDRLAAVAVSVEAADAAEAGYRFADDPSVRASKSAMGRALLASRDGPDPRGADILLRVRADVEPVETFDRLLTAELLAGMDEQALARLSRGLHDRVLAGEPGYGGALTDLVGLLEELPPRTAGALMLGLLAAMYLEAMSGTSRIPPRSPVDLLLLALVARPFAETAAFTVTRRLEGNERQPLLMPQCEVVVAAFETAADTMETDALQSIRIAGVETLTAAQEDPDLQLRAMLGKSAATGAEILARACELFGLPPDRVRPDGGETIEYHLAETIGFRRPAAVYHSRENA